MLTRFLLLLALGAAGLFHQAPVAGSTKNVHADLATIRLASHLAGHRKPSQTIAWLRHRAGVRSSFLGTDGTTIEIIFRDGLKSAILPGLAKTTRFSAGRSRRPVVMKEASAPGERALVLEPFATNQIGGHDGDPIAADLQNSGFQVQQIIDQAVTVNVMSTLWQYNVVYMHTHAGVNDAGSAVIATGQVANHDPATDALVVSGDVMAVGVTDDSQIYYGVLIPYFGHFENQFPANSLLYIDTCDLLRSKPLWDALAAKGVSTFVSWDYESQFRDGTPAAKTFFGSMVRGATVAEALASVRSVGQDVSTVAGKVAHLGYVGDGYVTLHGRNAPPPTPTPLPATAPVPPTGTPVTMPDPGPGPTIAPSPVLSASVVATVKPGTRQVVQIQAGPVSTVSVTVTYPDGSHRSGGVTTDQQGVGRYTFLQPGSKITHRSRTALVVVKGAVGSVTAKAERSYEIGFGPVDVSVLPRVRLSGRPVELWVHSRAKTTIQISVQNKASGFSKRLRMHTGARGWAHRAYLVRSAALSPVRGTITVVAKTTGRGTIHSARTTFQLR